MSTAGNWRERPWALPLSHFMDSACESLPSLDVDAIRRGRSSAVGSRLLYFDRVDSTNRVLETLPPTQLHHGLVTITDYQLAGRGRAGRTWSAPPRSSLLLSVLLHQPPHTLASDGVLVATLAVAD